jgi:crossover junction endonuclease MUS81
MSTGFVSNVSGIEEAVLPLGDILLKTDEGKEVALIERKSLSDLLASIKDGRYEEQSYRLIHSSGHYRHNILYIVEGSLMQMRNPMDERLIMSAMVSLQYFKGFSVIRTSSLDETAKFVLRMADKIDREFVKGTLPWYLMKEQLTDVRADSDVQEPSAEVPVTGGGGYSAVVKKVKKENVSRENIGEIMLCQIPGISSKTATAIMAKFDSFFDMLKAVEQDPSCLDGIMCDKRKISKTCVESIVRFFITK